MYSFYHGWSSFIRVYICDRLWIYQCEFDLWWLLRRKQRDHYGDGRVYFYDKKITMKELVKVSSETSKTNVEKKNEEI